MRPFSLLLVFLLAKALVLIGRPVPLSLEAPLAYLWQDVLVVLLFAGLEAATRRRPWVGRSVYAALVGHAAVNVPVARVLGTPLTWMLLRAARGPLSDSILHHVTLPNLLCLALVLVASAVLPRLLRRLPVQPSLRWRLVAVLAGVGCVLFGPAATTRVDTAGLHRNMLVALVTTALPRVAAEEYAGEWRVSPFGSTPAEDLTSYRGAARGRNVVVIHLESTAACYLHPYGAAEDPMPHLTDLGRASIRFDNAYSAYPETIRSFFAVQCGIYPAPDTEPTAYERVAAPSLANVLAGRDYRTGLFHSGRFAYLDMESVLRGRGYETCEDAGDIGGEHDSSFGIDEESTVRRILAWLDGLPPGQRFLATYLPIAGHHPYSAPDGPFPSEREIDRYRNALHYADAAVNELLDGLRQRGHGDDTLVVVLGDHGEAFGQHPGNFGHTLQLYEENVRVPLLFALPGSLPGPIHVGRVASLVDVTPTVLDLLGLPLPEGFQGRSLLEPQPALALFCTDYSLLLLGLRDGRWKLIDEPESGRSRLFDLEGDPGETADLAAVYPERVAAYREHLRRWAAAQKGLVQRGGAPR